MNQIEEIYQLHAQTVYRYLYSLCHDEKLAEDLMQETFCRAIRSVHRYNGSCKMSVWLCQIAKHLWYQHLEKHKREILTPLVPEEASVPSSEDLMISGQTRIELLKAIHSLPDPGKEVVYLRLFGNLSFREIGEIMGKKENWARVTFYRNKEKLKGGISDE